MQLLFQVCVCVVWRNTFCIFDKQELNKKSEFQEKFSKEIDELSQETEELVEEIDKWQM